MGTITQEKRNKTMTKRALQLHKDMSQHSNRSIYHVYGRMSNQKLRAWEQIYEEMKRYDGFDLTVLSFNTFMFTCGYYYYNDLGQKILVYHTPTKREEYIITES